MVPELRSDTLQMTIFDNSANASISFSAYSQVKAIPNVTSPTITLSPQSGVLQPRQNTHINITVYMPLNAKPGTTWTAIIQAVQTANQTASSGATIQSGVAKVITITALPLKINYLELASGGIIIAILAGFGAYYSILRRRAKVAKARARRKRALKRVAKRITPKKKARAKRRTKHRRTTRRRKR